MVTFQGHTFSTYRKAALAIYVSPGAAEQLTGISRRTVVNAIHDGRLEGQSTNTVAPFTASLEVLALWTTLRNDGGSFRKHWKAGDLIRASVMLPTVNGRTSIARRRLVRRAIRLAESDTKAEIRVQLTPP